MATNNDVNPHPHANPDPVTGEPGAHPVGTGVGAASFGVVGTAVGTIVGGPVGGAVGAVVGSVVGGLVGKGVAETFDPTVEHQYWQNNYRSRPYVEPGYDYDNDYAIAYRIGYESYPVYAAQGMTFADAEPLLQADFERQRGKSRLSWGRAKQAAQDAWHRVDNLFQGRRENDAYWRHHYQSRPYIETGYAYDDYAPAYWMGHDSYRTYGLNHGLTYEQAESYIRSDYERTYGTHRLDWERAKYAIQDAWNRLRNPASYEVNASHRQGTRY